MVGDLDEVPELVKTYDADAVAIIGGEAILHTPSGNSPGRWRAAGVESLVESGLVEAAGPRLHIRPYVGLTLVHVEQPHFAGWRCFAKRATDLGADQRRSGSSTHRRWC